MLTCLLDLFRLKKKIFELPGLPLLPQTQFLAHAVESLLVCIFLVVKRDVFFLDRDEVDMGSEHKFILLVYFSVYFLELLLELLDVFFGMGVHLIENHLCPF